MDNKKKFLANGLHYGPTVGMFLTLAKGLILYYGIVLIFVGACGLIAMCLVKPSEGKAIARSLVFGVLFAFVFPAAVYLIVQLLTTGAFETADK